jgi:hypothetical protein
MPKDGRTLQPAELPREFIVPDLSLSQQIVTWSLRRYAAGDGRAEVLAPMFRRIFGLAGIEEALTAFACLMVGLEHRGRHPIRIEPLTASRLSADEACVLRLMAAQQRGDDDTATAVASWLVHAPAIEGLLEASQRLASALAARQHLLEETAEDRPPANVPLLQPTKAVAELDEGEALLLRGIRLWVDRFKRRECGLWDLNRHFVAHGLGEATPSLHGILFNSSVATTRPLDVRCARCPSLSPDEARLLHAVACLQAGDEPTAQTVLANWLPPAAVRLTIEAVRGLAATFTAEHVRLPQRRWRFPELTEPRLAYAAPAARPEGRLH